MKKQRARASMSFPPIPRKFEGGWIAIKDSKIVGFGPTIRKALEQSSKEGIENPTVVKVPKRDQSYLLGMA